MLTVRKMWGSVLSFILILQLVPLYILPAARAYAETAEAVTVQSQAAVIGPDAPVKKWEIDMMGHSLNLGENFGTPYTPIIGLDGTIYAGDGSVNAITPNGQRKWELLPPTSGLYRPLGLSKGSDNTLYVSQYGSFWGAVDAAGNVKWRGSYPEIYGTPIPGPDGLIYMANDQKLLSLHSNGSISWELPIGGASNLIFSPEGDSYFMAGRTVYAVDSEGSLLWSAPIHTNSSPVVASRMIRSNGSLFFATNTYVCVGGDQENCTSYSERSHLYSFDSDGNKSWELSLGEQNIGPLLAQSIPYLKIGPDNTLYVNAGGQLTAFALNGSQRWSKTNLRLLTVSQDGTIYANEGGALLALDPSGNRKWSYTSEWGGFTTDPTIDGNGTLYIGVGNTSASCGVLICSTSPVNGWLLAISPGGTLKWSYKTGYFSRQPVLGPDGTLYVATSHTSPKLIAFGNGCSPVFQTTDWTIRSDRCWENADGTRTMSGNVRLNDVFRLTADAIVEPATGVIRSYGKLYMPVQNTELGGKAVLSQKDTVIWENKIIGHEKEPPGKSPQKIVLGGIPFTIKNMWVISGKTHAVLEMDLFGGKRTMDVIFKDESLSFDAKLKWEKQTPILYNGLLFKEIEFKYDGKKEVASMKIGIALPKFFKTPIEGFSGTIGVTNKGEMNTLGAGVYLNPPVILGTTPIALKEFQILIDNLSAETWAYRGSVDLVSAEPLLLPGQQKIWEADDLSIEFDFSPRIKYETGNLKFYGIPFGKATGEIGGNNLWSSHGEIELIKILKGSISTSLGYDFRPSGTFQGSFHMPLEHPLIPLKFKGKEIINTTGSIDSEKISFSHSFWFGKKMTINFYYKDNQIRMQGLDYPEGSASGLTDDLYVDGYRIDIGPNLKPITSGSFSSQALDSAFSLDQPYREVLVNVSWESGSGPVTLVTPDGKSVTPVETEEEQDGILSVREGQQALFLLTTPVQGSYRIEYDDALLSGVQVTPYELNAIPEFSFIGVDYHAADQNVNIAWTAKDIDDAAEITLYYDTDNEHADGQPIAGASYTTDPETGSHLWDVSGLPHGTYWIYAKIDDGKNAPVIAYSSSPITHIQTDAPQPPTELQASPRNGGLDLTWMNTPEIDAYHLSILDPTSKNVMVTIPVDGHESYHLPKGTVQPGEYVLRMEAVREDDVRSIPAEINVTLVEATPPSVELQWSNGTGITADPELTLTAQLPEGVTAEIVHQGDAVRSGLTGTIYEAFTLNTGMNRFVVKAVDAQGDLAEIPYDIFLDDIAPVLEVEPPVAEDLNGQPHARIQGRTTPGSTLLIDGQQVELAADGTFNTVVALPSDKVNFVVKAVNKAGVETVQTASFKDKPITLEDPNLEAAIRLTLNIQAGVSLKVRDMEQLTELFASDKGIQSLAGLEYAVNLQELVLNGNRIRSLDSLSGLKALYHLSLENNEISDIHALQNLTGLFNLYLSGNSIGDLEPIASLPQLFSLILDNTGIEDEDLHNIAPLLSLGGLSLKGNELTDITPLSNLSQLSVLVLGNNQISDISSLGSLTELEYLYLNDNQVNNIESLGELSKIKQLNASNNQISDITPLGSLRELEYLDLDNNRIDNIDPLSGLSKLVQVFADNNEIRNVTLSGLTELEILRLENNRIEMISLSGLNKLEWLYANNNQISDITSFSSLTELSLLYLENNRIESISALLNLENLSIANVRGNPLEIAAEPMFQTLKDRGVVLMYEDVFILQGSVTQQTLLGVDEPLAGAKVTIMGTDRNSMFQANTDADGNYKINVPSGIYEITEVWHNGQYMNSTDYGPIVMDTERLTTFDIVFPANNIVGKLLINGEVWNRGAGHVSLMNMSGGYSYGLRINDDGTFAGLLTPGTYEIRNVYLLDDEGQRVPYGYVNQTFTVNSDLVNLEYSVIPNNIFGTIFDDGKTRSLGPGHLNLRSVAGQSYKIDVQDNGTFFYALAAGTYTIQSFYLTGVDEGEDLTGLLNQSFTVGNGQETVELEVLIHTNRLLKGTLGFWDERPINPFKVMIDVRGRSSFRQYFAYVLENGTFNFYLPEGEYEIFKVWEYTDTSVESYSLSNAIFRITSDMASPVNWQITIQADGKGVVHDLDSGDPEPEPSTGYDANGDHITDLLDISKISKQRGNVKAYVDSYGVRAP